MKFHPGERTDKPAGGIIRAGFRGLEGMPFTLRQAQGEDLVSNVSKHKVGDEEARFPKCRIGANFAASCCHPATWDRCLSVFIRVK